MWAFGCGVIASGVPLAGHWALVIVGVLLSGPLVCATSQAVNDWFDRHVDAINEPQRPIPSGRMPGRWGLYVAIVWTLLSLAVSTVLGPWGFGAAVLGLLLAWAYSAPPLRLKLNGWFGNAACGLCYEGLAWVTGAAVMLNGAMPSAEVFWLAGLYSVATIGIMVLNDFKSIEGDRRMGVGSLPVRLGPERAARVACWFMLVPQAVVAGLLLAWGLPWPTPLIVLLMAAQLACIPRLLRDPRGQAPWYNATAVGLSVLGMMVSAVAVRWLA